jgi:hypothetical protein
MLDARKTVGTVDSTRCFLSDVDRIWHGRVHFVTWACALPKKCEFDLDVCNLIPSYKDEGRLWRARSVRPGLRRRQCQIVSKTNPSINELVSLRLDHEKSSVKSFYIWLCKKSYPAFGLSNIELVAQVWSQRMYILAAYILVHPAAHIYPYSPTDGSYPSFHFSFQ